MNYSKQREIIHNTLKSNPIHPTAEHVYTLLQEENPNISLATVYRNLNQLADVGKIKKIEGLEQSVHYDHQTHAHYHFICNNCKKVFDINIEVAPNIETDARKRTGFDIQGHEINFNGLCQDCITTSKGEQQ